MDSRVTQHTDPAPPYPESPQPTTCKFYTHKQSEVTTKFLTFSHCSQAMTLYDLSVLDSQ